MRKQSNNNFDLGVTNGKHTQLQGLQVRDPTYYHEGHTPKAPSHYISPYFSCLDR